MCAQRRILFHGDRLAPPFDCLRRSVHDVKAAERTGSFQVSLSEGQLGKSAAVRQKRMIFAGTLTGQG